MKSGLSRSNRSQSLFPGLERLVRKDQERSAVRSSSRGERAKESNDIVPPGNLISLLEQIRSFRTNINKKRNILPTGVR